MTLPDIDPEKITSLTEAKNVIEKLLHLYIKQQEEIQWLQVEIVRLKGHPKKPQFVNSTRSSFGVGKLVIPVLAFARSLLIRGNSSVKQFGRMLPRVKRGSIVADSEYDDSKLGHLFEATGRKLFAPGKRNQKTWKANRLYKKRKITIEPFFERFLLAFAMRGKLDRRGPQAWPYLVTCCFLYQLMVTYNLLHHGGNPMEVTHLIRML